MKNVAVVGAGYWGKNLVRNFNELGALAAVCDPSPRVREEMSTQYGVRTVATIEEALSDSQVRAVVIAAPSAQHFAIASQSLRAGRDVMVEKPMALRASEGEELACMAASNNRILMVGHILQYHPAILELKRMIAEGELGRIQYVYSSRLNLGKLRTEENILWSFAPHDISAILYLLDEFPVNVNANAGSYLHSHIPDTTLSSWEFRSGVKAHIFVSWLHPFKEQKLTIVGDRKMAVFDDLEPERKLVLYSHRVQWVNRSPVAHRDGGQVVPLPKEEPLRRECQHFLHCVATRQRPLTDAESGVQVLRVLEACEASLNDHGCPVNVSPRAVQYYAHPTAVVDQGAAIGGGTKIWHFSHIMAGSQLGTNCNLGQNVVISPGVKIGNNVKIQNNVSVYTGVELEDDVFCGPSMVFTNVINPRSSVNRKNEYQRTLVRRGVSIGANATIVCGVTIGEYSFVAAGAVVTRDVLAYALIMGVPAKQVGWMCRCGVRLQDAMVQPICGTCGQRYTIRKDVCLPADAPLVTEKAPIPMSTPLAA